MIRPSYLGAAKPKASSTVGRKGSIFDPGGTAAQLWMRNPDKRKVDLSGMFGPEDTLIAVARGMHPGVLRDMDDRATIRGALTVLHALGVKRYANVDASKLKSTMANSTQDDAALVKAAGLPEGTSIRRAASKMRVVVHAHKLDRAAWGTRQLYILDNMKGLSIGRAVATTVVGVAVPFGPIIAAAMAAHGAVSGTIVKNVVTAATADVKAGLASAKANQAKRQAAGTRAPKSSTVTPRASADKRASSRTAEGTATATTVYSRAGTTTVYSTSAKGRKKAASAALSRNAAASSAEGREPDEVQATSTSQAPASSPWWPWALGGAVVLVGGAFVLRGGTGGSAKSPRASHAHTARAVHTSKNKISVRRKP